MARVKVVGRDDLHWAFGARDPHVYIGGEGYSYRRTEYVDPFPSYAHQERIVRQTLKHVERKVDIKYKPTIYVLEFDTLARTNGYASRDHDYDNNLRWMGQIVLLGKRIPPHPAVTRYLVAHEYGHHVQYEIQRRRGMDPNNDRTLLNEYAKLRRVAFPPHYGGGTWHASPGELFANDFRILVAEVETEYWPHQGFTRPDKLKTVQAWWEKNL